jgi:hypothetical protein
MFDPMLKNMCLVISFVGCENAFILVVIYDEKFLLLSLVEC